MMNTVVIYCLVDGDCSSSVLIFGQLALVVLELRFMAEVLGGALPALQSEGQHSDIVQQTMILSQREMEQADAHHSERLALQMHLHSRDMSLQRTLHKARMQLDIDLARREAIRDMFLGRSQATQTTMIVDALSIGCVFALLYTFVPPIDSPQWAIQLYTACLALALLFLCLSTYIALQLQARMVRYDIHRPLLRYSCGQKHSTFTSYFKCHCEGLEVLSVRLFYFGATMTVSSAVVLMALTFAIQFHTLGASVAYVVLSGLGILFLWGLDLLVPSATHDAEVTEEIKPPTTPLGSVPPTAFPTTL